jgi:hypothetical protein
LREGDATGALAALALSAVPDLPAALTVQPGRVFAKASAQRGSLNAGAAALAAIASPAADEACAGIGE